MDEDAKRRLVGAAVLVALMVIFIPMLVDRPDDQDFGQPIVIPDPPAFDRSFDASVEPERDSFALPLPAPESGVGSVDLRPGAIARDPVPQIAPRPESTRPAKEPVAEPARAPLESWVVQVASLSAPDAAQRLQNTLRNKGYPAFIEEAKVGGTTYYRVRVGPETNRARAESMATAIGTETGGSPLVQQYH